MSNNQQIQQTADDIERERIKAHGRGWNAAMMGRKGNAGESAAFELGYMDVVRSRRPGSHLRKIMQ
jgi:hypothetical protein